MNIASAASAFPPHYYPQDVLLRELKNYWGASLPNPRLLERLYANVAVDGLREPVFKILDSHRPPP